MVLFIIVIIVRPQLVESSVIVIFSQKPAMRNAVIINY